jgi:hypothetical protein
VYIHHKKRREKNGTKVSFEALMGENIPLQTKDSSYFSK